MDAFYSSAPQGAYRVKGNGIKPKQNAAPATRTCRQENAWYCSGSISIVYCSSMTDGVVVFYLNYKTVDDACYAYAATYYYTFIWTDRQTDR